MGIQPTNDGCEDDYRLALEEAIASAEVRGDRSASAQALVELCRLSHRRRSYDALVSYADRAWELTQQEHLWEQACQLASLFGDIAVEARDYGRSYDHYANACAYALSVGTERLWQAVAYIDRVLAQIIAHQHLLPALGLCEMLVGYEEHLGLAERVPKFAQHFTEWRERIEQQRLDARLRGTGARN